MKHAEKFQKLMQNRENKLYRIAFSYVKNQDDALDCVQDALVKAMENIESLKQQEHFDTWIVRILINTCKDCLRKRQYHFTYEELQKSVEMSDREEIMDLMKSLDALKDDEKELIYLRYFENRKIIEISQAMNIREGTVKSRLNRVLGRLKNSMQ
ncbi:MAG: sigma-70 family RNA polymerase sigma factor [Peptostreptococcaceae bacterium]|nr:sigma-70 family RNA polymerase sigma factor [Peptostreptococcaceae bacterium]